MSKKPKPKPFAPGHSPDFDYEALLDGQRHILVRGKDFRGEVHLLRTKIHRAAKRRGLGVSVKIVGRGSKRVEVLAVEK